MGLDRWLDQQLHPETIDDSALERRLDSFPAMRLPQADLLARYPTPGQIRAAANRGFPLPLDPEAHAIFTTQIALYKAREERKAKGGELTLAAPAAAAPTGEIAEKPVADAGGQAPELAEDPPERGAEKHRDRLFPSAETQELLSLAPDARYKRLLAMPPDKLLRLRGSVSRAELAGLADGLNPAQKETLAALGGSTRMVGSEVLQARLQRDLFSERQLQAVMSDFWLNHFNVYLRKNGNEPFLLPALERDAIRPHALGRFEDLLLAVAQSPAMLLYLDNAQSIGPNSEAAGRARGGKNKGKAGLNENYARELMELHTLGVRCEVSAEHRPADPTCGQGYTQADVTEVAKVFSGWTIDRAEEAGTFVFAPRRHEPGNKTVLGQAIHDGGQNEGMEVLHLLASSPATARFVCTKLAVRFVSDTPPPSLVEEMTKSYQRSNGDMRAVLTTMFHSREFWSPAVYRAKVKTPLEFVTSAVRGSGADVQDALPLVQALAKLGMPLYGMQTPNGYSWTAEPWVSTGALVSRMNFALLLSAGRIRGTEVAWNNGPRAAAVVPASLEQAGSARPRDMATADAARERALEQQLLGGPVSDRTRVAVLAGLDDPSVTDKAADAFGMGKAKPTPDVREALLAGLLLGSPEFQRR